LIVPWRAIAAASLVLSSAAATAARADQILLNGGFELGTASWNRQDFPGGDGSFLLQTGTTSPILGTPVPPPPGGTMAMMTDAQGPGSHVLYQDFVVPTGVSGATLQFSLFIGNQATLPSTGQPFFASPAAAGLDPTTSAPNQQARVDILRGGTDPFSVAAADVIQNAFQTTASSTPSSGYLTFTVNVGAALAGRTGQTLRLRFAEADNVSTFQLGVDNVSLTTVPEPPSALTFGLGGIAIAAMWLRRRLATRGRPAGPIGAR
jgi:hypothetical protein